MQMAKFCRPAWKNGKELSKLSALRLSLKVGLAGSRLDHRRPVGNEEIPRFAKRRFSGYYRTVLLDRTVLLGESVLFSSPSPNRPRS